MTFGTTRPCSFQRYTKIDGGSCAHAFARQKWFRIRQSGKGEREREVDRSDCALIASEKNEQREEETVKEHGKRKERKRSWWSLAKNAGHARDFKMWRKEREKEGKIKEKEKEKVYSRWRASNFLVRRRSLSRRSFPSSFSFSRW